MPEELTLEKLSAAITDNAAAFRSRRQLQPAGGAGDKVFPPTFAGAVYATEMRRIAHEGGTQEALPCVLLDSVQSQANRMEEALQDAVDEGLELPVIEVDFSPFFDPENRNGELDDDLRLLEPIGKVTSLQAPHRLADAILRDSVLVHDGKRTEERFRDSEHAKKWRGATSRHATPLFELCPTALLFGMWGSPDKPGGLGAKFERAIVSEIVGINCPAEILLDDKDPNRPQNLGLRRDPLNISKLMPVREFDSANWELADDQAAEGTVRPSEVNHGNVPFSSPNSGITIDYAEQTTTLSLICLRRLRFPVSGQPNKQRQTDHAAQTVLAALGLCAATLAAEQGLDLRSRCLLWPEGPMEWDLLATPGKAPERFSLNSEAALNLLKAAIKAAEDAGVTWNKEPIRLQPSNELVRLVVKSQALAIKEQAGETN